MQALVGERLAAQNREHHDPCMARVDRDSKRMADAKQKVGKSRMEQSTRFSATIESVVLDCVINCVQQDPDDRTDIESSRGDNLRDCQQAASVLSDLAIEVAR